MSLVPRARQEISPTLPEKNRLFLPPVSSYSTRAESFSREWEHQRLGVLFVWKKNRGDRGVVRSGGNVHPAKGAAERDNRDAKARRQRRARRTEPTRFCSRAINAQRRSRVSASFGARRHCRCVSRRENRIPTESSFSEDEVEYSLVFFGYERSAAPSSVPRQKSCRPARRLPFCAPGGIGDCSGR